LSHKKKKSEDAGGRTETKSNETRGKGRSRRKVREDGGEPRNRKWEVGGMRWTSGIKGRGKKDPSPGTKRKRQGDKIESMMLSGMPPIVREQSNWRTKKGDEGARGAGKRKSPIKREEKERKLKRRLLESKKIYLHRKDGDGGGKK